jgi:hypothetical protein
MTNSLLFVFKSLFSNTEKRLFNVEFSFSSAPILSRFGFETIDSKTDFGEKVFVFFVLEGIQSYLTYLKESSKSKTSKRIFANSVFLELSDMTSFTYLISLT